MMHFKMSKSTLLKGLFLAQNIADKKSSTPSVAHVLLDTSEPTQLLCAATDLRTAMQAHLPAEVIDQGGLTLAARQLFDIVKNLPSDQVEIKSEPNNWAEIRSGRSRYRLVGLPKRDFPELSKAENIQFTEIDGKTFLEMISCTLFSVSTDDTRVHLSGVYFESDGDKATMVSTDGHRLSKAEAKLGQAPSVAPGVIIPRKGIAEVRKFLESVDGSCDIAFDERNMYVKANDVLISIALLDAQFPPYKQVIPQENDKQIILDRRSFLEALRRAAIVSSERSWGVKMELSTAQLRLSSDNPDLGEAQEDIEIEYKADPLTIGFNARYFIDALNEIKTDKVILELNGELDPGLVRPHDTHGYVAVVMPMRI